MNVNRVYSIINETLDSYSIEGVDCNDLLQYLNKSEENFEYIYNKCLKKVNSDQLETDDDLVKEAVKDVIRERIAFLNDTSTKK